MYTTQVGTQCIECRWEHNVYNAGGNTMYTMKTGTQCIQHRQEHPMYTMRVRSYNVYIAGGSIQRMQYRWEHTIYTVQAGR